MEAQQEHIHDRLVQRCLEGDSSAFKQLYRLYSRSMYNVAYRLVHDEDEAEDVLQEAFISAFRSLDHYRGDSTFGAWLKRIVINKGINALKKRKMERLPEDDRFDVVEEEDEFEDYPLSVEKVKAAIERLPDGYRMVLSLYLIEGYDHGEIAEIMGISESTSKSQFNRSKKKLREILEVPHE